MRDLRSVHVELCRRIGAVVCAVLASAATGIAIVAGTGTASAAGKAASAQPATYGPAQAWGGTEIRSLDPVRLSAPTSGGADLRTQPVKGRGPALAPSRHDEVLSNETTFTRWAYVDHAVDVHAAPRAVSARAGRLTWYTEDGFSSTYLVLRAHWDARGREWVEVRIPGRPNGRTGWVPRSALGSFHLTHMLVVVNRERQRMDVYRHGRRIWNAPVGVGARATPTPAGHFWIDERFKITDPRSGYYPYALGTTDYSTLTDWPGGGVVGIHGPYYDPQGIPGDISHGCIRLEVAADAWLAGHVPLGAPVRVT